MFGAFTSFGKLGSLARAIAAAWTPSALWPDGAASPGMWIDPSTLPASFNDYTGTTPVSIPGTVADSANPVGLALDIRAGAPDTLGPELVVNGTFDTGIADWTADFLTPTLSWDSVNHRIAVTGNTYCTATTPFSVTAGKTYLLSATLAGTDPAIWFGTNGTTTVGAMLLSSGQSVYTAQSSGTLYAVIQGRGANGSTAYFDNISVKEIPGNHMLQSTSAARPLESARVNLLTRTEDFATFPPWYSGAFVITSNSTTAPDGTLTADTYVKTTAAGFAPYYQLNTYTGNAVLSFYAKYAGHQFAAMYLNGPDRFIYFDVLNGVVGSASAGCTHSMESVGNGWYRCVVAFVQGGLTNISFFTTPTDNVYSFVSDGTSGCYFWGTQLEPGTTATPYQPILTDGSSYPSTGITPFQLYDGVDDGMATASFTAGTLINGMDCMIPVRRDSGSNCVAGLYNGVSDANKFFGMAESASGSGCVGSGAGTPTVWVDNTQLTGGTAVTRGTLHTALTVGSYHILEFRNLDLSTWTATGFGLYSSYVFPGARGDIMLYPSTASTADKDAARQYLADKYGVTLP